MFIIKSGIKLAVFCSLLALPLMGISYSQDATDESGQAAYEPGSAKNFGEAIRQNKQLRERYEQSNAEDKKKIQERWEKNEQKRGETDGQNMQIREKRQTQKLSGTKSRIGRDGTSRMGGQNRGGGGRRR